MGRSQTNRFVRRNFLITQAYLIEGKSQRDIAKEFGISQQTVSRVVTQHSGHSDPEIVNMRRAEISALLSDLIECYAELAMPEKHPPSLNREGMPDVDEEGNIIRDTQAAQNAARVLLATLERAARHFGTDAPTRIAQTQTVHYTYEGVDVDDV